MKKEQFLFWRNQPQSILLSIFLSIALGAIIWMLIARHFGISWVYLWESQTTNGFQNVLLDSFENGILPFKLQIPVYFIQYEYLAKDLNIPLWASKLWTLGCLIGFSIMITCMSYFKRIYFLLSSTIAIIFIISLRIDLIGIGGVYSKWLFGGVFILLYIGLAYYYHTFGKDVAFWKKLTSNLAISAILGVLVFFMSKEKFPTIYLTGYGILIPFLITLTTIFLVASEIPFFFASLTTSQKLTGKPNFLNFHVVMLFYVGNLILLYLKNTKILTLDIFYIDDFYLLATSLILGVWGTRHNPLFQNVVPKSMHTWVFTAMIIIAASSIAYFNSVMNDAGIAALEDFIVYSHIGFGIVFWAYTVFNLKNETLADKQTFATIFYESQENKTIPLYIARGLGFLIMGVFIFKENSFPIKQSFAAYYNSLGDVYLMHYNELNHQIADVYYREALVNDEINHRLWYSRASLIGLKQKPKSEEIAERINHLQKATLRDGIPQDYALIAQEFAKSGQSLLANMEFKEGLEKFPKSAPLANNIALLYAQNKVLDSALHYLKKSEKYTDNPKEIETNLLSILIQKPFIAADSLDSFLNKNGDVAYEANRLALLGVYGKSDKTPFKLNFARKSITDTTLLDILQASYLHNYLLVSNHTDTTAFYITKKLANTSTNNTLIDFLKIAQQGYFFKQQNQQANIEHSRYLSYLSPARYQMQFGQNLLYLGESAQAIEQFTNLSNILSYNSIPDIFYHRAAALTEAGNLIDAEKIWQQVASDSSNLKRQYYAQKMLAILKAEVNNWKTYDDTTRFGILYYKRPEIGIQKEIAATIQNSDLKVKAYAYTINTLLEANKTQEADDFFQKLDKNVQVTLSTQSELNKVYLALCYKKQDFSVLASIIEKIPLIARHEHYRNFYKAILTESKNIKQAENLYSKALQGNPFDLLFYPDFIRFYNEKKKNKEAGYNLAVQAIRFQESSPMAWKMYIIQSLELNYIGFAEEGLEKLRELSFEDYEKYKTIYEKKKALLYGDTSE
ncbi:MAG: hypothetical protein MUC49_20600 [Raineya sp.]|jgi:hypothetical protein|nr:hypothetical protein [Raineya sp.]